MSDFLQALEANLREFPPENARILIGLSGGADSTALCTGLARLPKPGPKRLVAAHVNHQLRNSADADAEWTHRLARQLDITYVTTTYDTQAHADQQKIGLEEAARNLRHTFLADAARRNNCHFIALGHTADDQAETILHHILRGTGIAGLRGIPKTRDLGAARIIRPLLNISRQTIESWLHEIGQEFRTDETNADPRFTRNRIRQNLIPQLKQEYNPRVVEVLNQLGTQAAEVEQLLEDLARQALELAVVDSNPESVRLDLSQLARHPPHLQREIFRILWIEQAWPRQKMTFRDWHRLTDLVATSQAHSLPGGIEARSRDNLLVLRRLATEA